MTSDEYVTEPGGGGGSLGRPGLSWTGDGALGGPVLAAPVTEERLEPASMLRRTIAFAIDLVIGTLILIMVLDQWYMARGFDPLAEASLPNAHVPGLGEQLVVWVVIWLLYRWMWNAVGASPGKLMLGLRVVGVGSLGEKPGIVRGLKRAAGMALSDCFLFAGYVFAFFDDEAERRTLHDRIAGTRVKRVIRDSSARQQPPGRGR